MILWKRVVTWVIFAAAFELDLIASLHRIRPVISLPERPPTMGYTLIPALTNLLWNRPVGLVAPPAETNRLFIVEQRGLILVITNLASPTRTVFLDITDRVHLEGEAGLLGLAFHPRFDTNGQFFVFYTLVTTTAQGTGLHDRLSRFEVSASNPNQAIPDSELPFITQYDEDDNHNGGDLRFGPDGYLYVALGDEGGFNDILNNGQRIDKDFFSGILRIDVDKRSGNLPANGHPAASGHYSVPWDNPFVDISNFNGKPINPAHVRTEFWAIGLRNPWRIAFDAFTGKLLCADVGQNAREEVNVIVRGGNYGWSWFEGTLAYSGTPPSGVQITMPVIEYPRVGSTTNTLFQGNCIIGGIVYEGERLTQLKGSYVFGDFISGHVWAARPSNSDTWDVEHLTVWPTSTGYGGGPSAFGFDPSNRDVLIAEYKAGNARLYRLTYSSNVVGSPFPPTLVDTRAFSNLEVLAPQSGIVGYDLNTPFWSDRAHKRRWFSIPNTNFAAGFQPTNNWAFPTGTVWIKHFDLELTNGMPSSAKRLETRFLVRNTEGVYGITYRWGDSLTNATLVPEEGMNESFVIHDGGTVRTQTWRYPGRSECLQCHTPQAGFALGFTTAQLNRDFDYDGTVTNQLLALSQAGYFSNTVTSTEGLPVMADAAKASVPVEHRVRSYLAANCAQCHQPGGSAQGYWDARFSTPLHKAGIINGPLVNNFGSVRNKVIAPGSLQFSILYQRVANFGTGHMPPLATSVLNTEALGLLQSWITNMTTAGMSPNLRIRDRGDGSFSVLFDGIPEISYRIEYSEEADPPAWQTLRTTNADSNGVFEVIDRPPPGTLLRYYRSAYP